MTEEYLHALCGAIVRDPEVLVRNLPAICAAMLIAASPSVGRTQSPNVPLKFEVVSVKPCKDGSGAGFRGGRGTPSPGRLDLNCQTLRVFIVRAYVYYGDGHLNLFRSLPEIQGAPDWIDDRYSITAKAEGIASQDVMNGPMLQALLEDRFQLKIHRETKQVPVYKLTIAKGGLKIPRFQPGNCTPIDSTRPLEALDLAAGQKLCIDRTTGKGGSVTMQLDGMSIDGFMKFALQRLDRPVIDKTGLTGLFDFHLTYSPDQIGPDGATMTSDPAGPSIFTALQQQLGLKLTEAEGPGEVLVIDHVERPSENQLAPRPGDRERLAPAQSARGWSSPSIVGMSSETVG
jgi:uncharacterized protein (TIGR03435 family)